MAALKPQTCKDCDEDCFDIPDKVRCWLYAPERGMCPFLRPDADAAVQDATRDESKEKA